MTDNVQSQETIALNEALRTGFETADFQALAKLVADDAVMLPARGRPVRGRAAILAFWNGVRNRFTGMVFTTGESKSLGDDVAREIGTYVMAAGGGGAAQAEGKFMFVWRKVEGASLLDSAVWTRNEQAMAGGRQAVGQGGPRQGGPRQGGGYQQAGRGGGAQGGYRQAGYRQGGGQGNEGGPRRNRGGIAGQQGGIGGIGAGLGMGGRRGNPQGPGRGQGGQAGGGGRGQNLYGDNLGLYSDRDE